HTPSALADALYQRGSIAAAPQPRKADRWHAIDFGEEAPNEYLAITLHRDRVDVGVRPGQSVLKTAVQSTVCLEPRNMVAVYAVDCGEEARNEHLAITLHQNRTDIIIGPGQVILKIAVQGAVRIEPRNSITAH